VKWKNNNLIVAFVVLSNLLSAKDIYVSKNIGSHITEIKNYLHSDILHLQNPLSLELAYYSENNFSKHYTFQLNVNNIPMFGQKIKINVNGNGKIILISNNIYLDNMDMGSVSFFNNLNELQDTLILIKSIAHLNSKHIYNINKCFWIENNITKPALELRLYKPGCDSTYIIDYQNFSILNKFNNALNYADTIIRLKVFMPDPLTSSHQIYGGVFINNLDANSAWLDAALIDTLLEAKYDTLSNSFFLENIHGKIVDANAPNVNPIEQASPFFYFNRTQSGFEDGNALFHITNFKKQINNLGFTGLMNQQILIDAHGHNGDDNSTFYKTNPPLLDLGTGGVNDAEDADVIIHEYSHGLSWQANNNFISTAERLALDEGLADYFATSYSRKIDTFGWHRMFTWDGHNEFWGGRNAIVSSNYASPFSLNVYVGGSVWNNAMSLIWEKLGAEITDKLMLQSMYFYTDSTTLPQAANYILQADTLLYQGIHSGVICEKFVQKNILTNYCYPLEIKEVYIQNNSIKIFNQLAFGNKIDKLQIELPIGLFQTTANIMDINGNKVYEQILKKNNNNIATIEPIAYLNGGIYILEIQNQYFKITVF
jgi:hypothetical protein